MKTATRASMINDVLTSPIHQAEDLLNHHHHRIRRTAAWRVINMFGLAQATRMSVSDDTVLHVVVSATRPYNEWHGSETTPKCEWDVGTGRQMPSCMRNDVTSKTEYALAA